MIQAGEPAPDFTLPLAGGGSVTLSALYPRQVAVVFYPKDDTPACTDEVAGFSARLRAFARAGARVVAISRDSLRRHQSFARKHGLTVPLASDEDGQVCAAWGVWAEKQLFGRRYLGIVRSTFLVGGDGIVRRVWSPVRVGGHVEEVLEAVKAATQG